VIAVRVILITLPTAVEITGIGRSVCRSDFGLRFLAAMVILGRVRLTCSLTRTLPIGLIRSEHPSHERSMKCLSRVVNQALPRGMVYRKAATVPEVREKERVRRRDRPRYC
jgi:hypothetical protein